MFSAALLKTFEFRESPSHPAARIQPVFGMAANYKGYEALAIPRQCNYTSQFTTQRDQKQGV